MSFRGTLGWSAVIGTVFTLGFSLAASADSTVEVMSITTDAFQGNFSISVLRDDTGAVSEMLYETPDSPNGVLTIEQAKQGPQLLYNHSGHDVLYFSVEDDFNAVTGGHGNVRFLENGITGNYKNFRVDIQVGSSIVLLSDPNPSDPDSDDNPYTGVFDKLFMQKHSILGALVGISKVIPSE